VRAVRVGTRPRRRRQPLFWVVLIGVAVVVGAVVFVLARNDNGNPQMAQLKGSGVAATQTRPLPRFEGIVVAVGATVTIRAAQKPAAVVRADDNLVHRITTRVRSGVLTVGSSGAGFTTKTPLTVMIGVPNVAALTVNRGGAVALRNVRGERLSVTLSGRGSIKASGAVGKLEATLRSFGNMQLRDVTAQNVHAVLSGSGQIVVTATRKLDATLSGSGAIRYYGNPAQVRKTVVGEGSVSAG
jgi:putative autotransporter adhesin-like protein